MYQRDYFRIILPSRIAQHSVPEVDFEMTVEVRVVAEFSFLSGSEYYCIKNYYLLRFRHKQNKRVRSELQAPYLHSLYR